MFGEIYARLSQYRKQNQFDFLYLNKFTEEKVNHKFSKNWRRRIDIQCRNKHIQTKETLATLRTHYGLNCISDNKYMEKQT